jgi:hypothetical protein
MERGVIRDRLVPDLRFTPSGLTGSREFAPLAWKVLTKMRTERNRDVPSRTCRVGLAKSEQSL